jgi:hypothetical protein
MLAAPLDGRIIGAAIVGPTRLRPDPRDRSWRCTIAARVYDFVKIPHLHPTLAEIWTYPAEEQ